MPYEKTRIGESYGALTVTGISRKTVETVWWICRCKCGETRAVEERRLTKGMINTCLKCEIKNKQEKIR